MENISCESCEVALFDPSFPQPRVVIVCTYLCCGFAGSLCRSKVIQDTILLGRVTILKEVGTCEGTCDKRIWVSLLSVLSMSRKSASATWFLVPGNHWLYLQILWDMNQDA